jgi:DNA-binding beta-propeller fold protein YncE
LIATCGGSGAGAQCGAQNDPVFVFDADTFALIAGPIGTGGVMGPIIANPFTGKLYVTASGVSKEVNPITFAVTTTGFGTVEAVNSVTNRLFAVQDNNLQIINGANDTVVRTVSLGYSPAAMGVNNALGQLYLANPAANRIQVRNQQNGNFVKTLSFGAGNQPWKIAVDSIRGRLYVGVLNGTSWSVWAIEDLTSARTCMREGGP